MKLLEFLETIRENDSSGPGKFVGARLTRDSERAIMRWMRDNGLRKKEPRACFHITVVGDKERGFPWNPATFDPPLEIDPNTYKLEKFGDAIVLSFSVPELEKRHEEAVKKHGINWKFPTYQPHLTLSFDETGLNNMERLLKPTFPMYVANEYEQPWKFTEEDSSSERRRDTRIEEDTNASSL
jgi:2'-5' RNA ligase